MASLFTLPNGGRLQYQTTRPIPSRNNNPALVFLHYWGGSVRTWRKVIAGLEKLYPTIAMNLPGWAGSDLPADQTGESKLTIHSQAQSVRDLLLSLPCELTGHGVILVGHSMGAKICMALASTILERRQIDLKGMMFVAPAPPSPLVLPDEMREQQVHAYDSAESVEWTVTNVLSRREMLTREDIEFAILDGLAGMTLAKEAWPSYGMGEEVTVPQGAGMKVVVLAGGEDVVETKERVGKEVVQVLREKGWRVTFDVVDGGRHLIPLERPEVVVDAVMGPF